MADVLSCLGSITNTAVGTWTAYQAPAAKGAKVSFQFSGIAGVNSTLAVAVNGLTIFQSVALTSGNIVYSNATQWINTGAATIIDGSTGTRHVAPGPTNYILGPGQLVTITIGTAAFTSLTFQVMGIEIDNI